jgi:hypothetical protein
MTQLPVHLGQQPHAGGAGMTYTIIGKCRKNGTIVVPFFWTTPVLRLVVAGGLVL